MDQSFEISTQIPLHTHRELYHFIGFQREIQSVPHTYPSTHYWLGSLPRMDTNSLLPWPLAPEGPQGLCQSGSNVYWRAVPRATGVMVFANHISRRFSVVSSPFSHIFVFMLCTGGAHTQLIHLYTLTRKAISAADEQYFLFKQRVWGDSQLPSHIHVVWYQYKWLTFICSQKKKKKRLHTTYPDPYFSSENKRYPISPYIFFLNQALPQTPKLFTHSWIPCRHLGSVYILFLCFPIHFLFIFAEADFC